MEPRYAARRLRLQWLLCLAMLLLGGVLQAQPQAAARPATTPATRTVLVVGDSLSAAYGLASREGWVALTAERIAREKPGWRVVNASISGETTAGGAARIVREVVLHRPAVVIIELGGNDALRGLPLRQARLNLARMIGASQGVGAEVVLLGMRIPPNYGRAYADEFERSYVELAQRFGTHLLPFFLAPIAQDRDAFQADNIHPVAAVQPQLRDHVWPVLEPLLR
jgi:acyl-CoA thioesterase I